MRLIIFCGFAVAIWEQIQSSSAEEESNVCSWFSEAFLLQTMYLDTQFESFWRNRKWKIWPLLQSTGNAVTTVGWAKFSYVKQEL